MQCCLQIAFVEMPNFNFDLTLYGGDIGFLPGLEAWITAVIKDSVLRWVLTNMVCTQSTDTLSQQPDFEGCCSCANKAYSV